MVVSFVRSANSELQASPSAGWNPAPPAERLITAVVSDRSGATSSTLAGFTQYEEISIAPADGTYRHYVSLWYKITGASEPTSYTATTNSGGASILTVTEWSKEATDTWTFFDSAQGSTFNAGTITSQATGTTSSTSGPVACIATCSIKSPGSDINPWTTWTNSFTNHAEYNGGVSVIEHSVALLNSSTSGTKTSTASGSGTDRSVGAGILVFSLGAGTPSGQVSSSFGGTFNASGRITNVSFVEAGALFAAASGTSITPVIPASAQLNDIMLMPVMTNGSSTFTTPTDWNILGTAIESNANQSTKWFWKRHDGSEANPTSTTSATLSTTNGGYGRIYLFRGCLTTGDPFEDVTMAGTPTSSTTPTSAAIDTTGAKRMAVSLLSVDDDNTWSSGNPPAGWSSIGRVSSTTGGDAMMDGIIQQVATASSVPQVTIGTMSAADFWRTLTLALIPEPLSQTISGSTVSSFGGTLSAAGSRVVLGSTASLFGGTFTANGTVAATEGQVVSSFGGTFATSGIRRIVGNSDSNFGGAFLGTGNNRQFGSVGSAFGGTTSVTGIDRQFGTTESLFGFSSTVSGQKSVHGQVDSSFGGTLSASGSVPFTGLRALVAYDFDEGTGTTAEEINGGTAITGVPAWDTGLHGSALRLDHVNGPSLDPFSVSTNFTIMFDVFIVGDGNSGYNLILNGVESEIGTIQQHNAGSLEWYPFIGPSGTVIPVATYTNIALVATGSDRRLVVNGVTVATAGSASVSGTNPFTLGGITGYEPDIKIDNLRVFDRDLTDSQIATMAGEPVLPGGTAPATTGSVTSLFGGTFDAAGIIAATEGQVTSSFGGIFVANGVRRSVGAVSTNFGGAFLGAGNDRQFGTVVTSFGFVTTTSGLPRRIGSVSSLFGGAFLGEGRNRQFGQVVSSFGGTFLVEGNAGGGQVLLSRASGGAFVALDTLTAVGGVWISTTQSAAINGEWKPGDSGSPGSPVTGIVTSSFGGVFLCVGLDRKLGSVVSSFGGAFLGAGNNRQFGAVVSSFGGSFTVSGEVPTGWPNASNTGATGTLTPDGSQFLGTNGATYQNVEFTDTVTIAGDNMNFTNCRFLGGAGWVTLNGGTVTDCTFAGGGFGVSSSSNVTFLRAKIENFSSDSIHITADQPPGPPVCDNIVIEDSYVYNSNPSPGAHADGMHVRGSSNLILRHCYIDMGPEFSEEINAAIFFEEAQGGNSNFLVEDCYLKGSGYFTAYLNTGTGTVQNNTFVTADQGIFYNNEVSAGITGEGNVDENGNPIDLHP